MTCPLCSSSELKNLGDFKGHKKLTIEFYLCKICQLLFKDPSLRLALEQEKHRYETHNNDLTNSNYMGYMEKSWKLILGQLDLSKSSEIQILDYGCGPTQAFEYFGKKSEVQIDSYDPLFFPKLDEFKPYDGIVMHESFEHFYQPGQELATACRSLKPDSQLWIHTQIYTDDTDLNTWSYTRDPTHVVFLTDFCLEWIRKNFKFSKVVTLKSDFFALIKKAK